MIAPTPTPAEYARSFDAHVADVLGSAAPRCPGLLRRLDKAGVTVDELVDVTSLDRIPVLSKDELLELQQADPPFAGFVPEDAPVRRVFQSPGPLYEAEMDTADPWRWAPALRAAGFSSDDLVLNAFGYHLSPAGAMFEEACRTIGCKVLPGGVGNIDLQVQACADLGVTAYIGLPSYLRALLEKAEEHGHDPKTLRLGRAFVTAEPLPPDLRAWLTDRVPVVRQGYGTAETGNLGFETEATDGFHVPADALVQICDLSTGDAVYDGREGQVVVTIFDRHAPLVRFGTGDLSAWATDESASDEPTPRIRGWLGRVGDAVKVRGMFLHPRQARTALDGAAGVAAYRFVIERPQHRDELRCEVVAADPSDREGLPDMVRAMVRSRLRFDVAVEVMDELPADASMIEDRRTWE